MLAELDQVIVAVWVGLAQFGLRCGLVIRNLGPWALRRAQSFRKAKPKLRFAKRPRQYSSIIEPRSTPTSVTSATSLKFTPEVLSSASLSPGMSETLTKVLTVDSLMEDPIFKFSARVSVGSVPLRSGCVDSVQITPESRI
ncbi:hypothetical protein SLA2020_273200 [Shorea laevis]